MIAYIIKVSLCWILFYAFYQVLYKKISFFSANRAYLIITLLLGVVIPLLQYIPIVSPQYEAVNYVAPILLELDQFQVMVEEEKSFDYLSLLLGVYLIGLVIASSKFVLGLYNIGKLYIHGEKEHMGGYVLVRSEKLHLPFSFYKWVFISNKLPLKKKIKTILEHELCHINERHTIDVLFVELIKIAFWCSPPIYLYKKELKQVHEYIADHVTVANENKEEYGQLLLGQSSSGIELSLTHQFFNSHLKKRIQMMNQKKSSKKTLVSYLAIVPVILFLGLSFSSYVNKEDTTIKANDIAITENDFSSIGDPEKEITKKVSTLFKLNKSEFKNQKQSTYNSLMDNYPEHAQFIDNQFHQNAIMHNIEIDFAQLEENNKFTIDTITTFNADTYEETVEIIKTERIREQDILKRQISRIDTIITFDTQTGKEDVRIVKYYKNEEGVLNTPITINGEPIAPPPAPAPPAPPKGTGTLLTDGDIYTVVEEMPRFPGCEDVSSDIKEKDKCAKEAMLNFIYSNLKYPEEAKKLGVEGITVVQFVVRKNGLLTDIELLRDIGASCGESTMGVVKEMNAMKERWIPGKQNGQIVDVTYTLPVKYKLSAEPKLEIENKMGYPRIIMDDANAESHLAQNQPNPFRENTQIQFTLKEAGKATLTVYDVENKTIAKITDIYDKGTHVVELTKQQLGTSGVLYYQLESGDFTATKKMILNEQQESQMPLFVIDGEIINTIEGVEPSSISSITVFKGAEAIEKYGIKGKDGVVVVVSKEKNDQSQNKDELLRFSDLLENKIEFQNFKVFPNPVRNTLNLSFLSKEEGPTEIHLFDEMGKELLHKKLDNNTCNEIFDLSYFNTTQVLFLTIGQNNKVHTQKIVRSE